MPATVRDAENRLSEEQKMDGEGGNVCRTPGLRLVHKRSACDGFFPRVKAADEIQTVEDLQAVPDHMLPDIARSLIYQEKEIDSKLSQALLRRLYDKDGILVERLYDHMLHSRVYSDKKGSTSSSASGSAQWMTMTGESYNLMIQSAARSNRHQLLAQLVFESTVLGMPLDTQTYITALRYQQREQSAVRYLREQLPREVHADDVSFVESMVSVAEVASIQTEQVPRAQDSTDLPTNFASVESIGQIEVGIDEKAVAKELTGAEEEEEEEAECAMMAYFFSEAEDVPRRAPARPAALRFALEGCSPLMAASFESGDDGEVEFDETTEAEAEYFDPFGQMNDEVKQVLLRLAREERAQQILEEQRIDFDHDATSAGATALNEQEFYGHYSF